MVTRLVRLHQSLDAALVRREPLLLALIVALQVVLSFHFLWFLPKGDEALHIYNAFRVAQGEWPYRDFFAYITPGTYLLGGGLLLASGKSILSLRLAMAGLCTLSVLLLNAALRRTNCDTSARLAIVFGFTCSIALTATNFSHHSVDSALFVVLIFLVLGRPMERRLWFWAGLFVGLDSLVHQAHGFYLCAAALLYLALLDAAPMRARLRASLAFALPIAALYLCFLLALIGSGSFGAFVEGAIRWPATIYRAHLAFGVFADNVFALDTRQNLAEQPFFLASKLLVLLLVAWSLLRTVRGPASLPAGTRLAGLLSAAFALGHLQTFYNASSYVLLATLAAWLLAAGGWRGWMTLLLVGLLSVQIARALTHPVRYLDDYVRIGSRLTLLDGQRFYRSAQTDALHELALALRQRGIATALMVGRSPEVYFLAGVANPSRYDMLLPVYLPEDTLARLAPLARRVPVIYDDTIEQVRTTRDFFDVHHYQTPQKLATMAQAPLYRELPARSVLLRNSEYILLAPSVPRDDHDVPAQRP